MEEREILIEELYNKQLGELERLSGLTSDEAKELLLNDIKKEIAHESALLIKEMENKTKEESEKKQEK